MLDDVEDAGKIKLKLRNQHKLLILHEIINDVQSYRGLKEADQAQDY